MRHSHCHSANSANVYMRTKTEVENSIECTIKFYENNLDKRVLFPEL